MPEPPVAPNSTAPEPGARVLLVDDEPANLLALEALLDGLGLDLVRARTGGEALKKLADRPFALVLLDVRMPGMDGLETASRLRQQEQTGRTPVIFVTGKLADELPVVEAYKLGAVDFLVKPLIPEIVRAKVAGFVELFEAKERARRQADQLRRMHDELEQRVRDRTADLSTANEALREADRRKDEFLAMLAHELRNPLAPIRTGLQVLALPQADRAATDKVREMMVRQIQHMGRIVDDLLDVSRIQQRKVTLRRERLDLARLVRLAVDDHRPGFDAVGVELAIDAPPAPLWVHGDQTRLTQVVGNLLHNSLKFTDKGGTVTVRVQADPGGRATVAVRDTGMGIEPDMLARLFEPFAQADRSLARSKGGLGLGLALVRGLTELHGGRVAATSGGPGQGSEFVIEVPLQPEPAPVPVPDTQPPADRGRLRVLVVEDNKDAADSLRVLLELFGYTVEVAYSGTAGVAAATAFGPDVILCDIGLPGLDGYAVAGQLRRNPATAKARLIALTGYGTDEDRRRSKEAGFEAHLTKPADPAALRALLNRGGRK